MSKPNSVEVGQMWKDGDQRSRGAGEFTVLGVGERYATVFRHETNRRSRIRLDRLLFTTEYTYIGMTR